MLMLATSVAIEKLVNADLLFAHTCSRILSQLVVTTCSRCLK